MNENQFPQIEFKGSGVSLPPEVKKLNPYCEPGDKVWWGNIQQGVLQEYLWDGDRCVALILVDDTSVAIPL